MRKSRKAIRAEKSPARINSRAVRRIWRAKIIPRVTSPPVISPNQTTAGMVASVLSARAPRAWSAAITWSISGWYACASNSSAGS